MISISALSRTDEGGILTLNIPTEFSDSDLEVLVVVNPVPTWKNPPPSAWPDGYFELFGSLGDSGFERHPQGELQDRQLL